MWRFWIGMYFFIVASCGLKEEQPERLLGMPSFLLSDFQYVSINTSGQKEWELRASEAVMYQNSDEVYIYNFTVGFYKLSNGMSVLDSILSANKGEINKKTLRVVAEGKVKIVASETSLETERIQWDNMRKLFFSDPGIAVLVRRRGVDLRGYSLVADASLKEIRMENIDAKIQQ